MPSPDVLLQEMSPRDGMQVLNRAGDVPVEDRAQLLRLLLQARFSYVEVGSYVHPKFESMRETPAVLAAVAGDVPSGYEGELAALVPNRKGYERFAEGPGFLTTVALFVAASEYYSTHNTRMTIPEAMAQAEAVASLARRDGFRLRAHLSAAFRDLTPEDGETDAKVTAELTERLLEAGCSCVALADTDGRATGADIERVLDAVRKRVGDLDRVGLHLHDRHADAVDRALSAYDRGIRIFDCAVGGIGGNQLVGAPGNIATDELVEAFESRGVRTGVDRPKVQEALALITRVARDVGDPVPSSLRSRGSVDPTKRPT